MIRYQNGRRKLYVRRLAALRLRLRFFGIDDFFKRVKFGAPFSQPFVLTSLPQFIKYPFSQVFVEG